MASSNVGTGNNTLSQVAAVSSTDVWAAGFNANATGGASPLLINWNGKTWNPVQAPVPNGSQFNMLNAIAALPTGTVWAVGRSDNGDLILNTNNG